MILPKKSLLFDTGDSGCYLSKKTENHNYPHHISNKRREPSLLFKLFSLRKPPKSGSLPPFSGYTCKYGTKRSENVKYNCDYKTLVGGLKRFQKVLSPLKTPFPKVGPLPHYSSRKHNKQSAINNNGRGQIFCHGETTKLSSVILKLATASS